MPAPASRGRASRGTVTGTRKLHGGPDRALCLFSLEQIEALQAEGHPVEPGALGENLTLAGLDWPRVRPDDVFRLGETVLVQITRFTSPCETVRARSSTGGTRGVRDATPGMEPVYARVLVPGEIAAGDRVERLAPAEAAPHASRRAGRRTSDHRRSVAADPSARPVEDGGDRPLGVRGSVHPFRSSRLAMPGHGFTHCDGFSHFIPGGTPSTGCRSRPGSATRRSSISPTSGRARRWRRPTWRPAGGHVRRGDIALLRNRLAPEALVGDPPVLEGRRPWTSLAACRWLVDRGVKAVGYDYPPDYPIRDLVTGIRRPIAPAERVTHHTFFPAGIGVIEYLVNLDRPGRDSGPVRRAPAPARRRRRRSGARDRDPGLRTAARARRRRRSIEWTGGPSRARERARRAGSAETHRPARTRIWAPVLMPARGASSPLEGSV